MTNKKFDFLSYGGNSGPLPGRKVSFFEHCSYIQFQGMFHILTIHAG